MKFDGHPSARHRAIEFGLFQNPRVLEYNAQLHIIVLSALTEAERSPAYGEYSFTTLNRPTSYRNTNLSRANKGMGVLKRTLVYE